jgi:hypothetical protein
MVAFSFFIDLIPIIYLSQNEQWLFSYFIFWIKLHISCEVQAGCLNMIYTNFRILRVKGPSVDGGRYATSRKVASSSSSEVIDLFQLT